MDRPVLLLMGPTASGKTDLALRLAEEYPVRLISVDSVMVYRGLDIGSAKPSAGILRDYPHDLIDIRDPAEPYSAAAFRHDALKFIDAALSDDKLPLLVGGTSLYFHVLYHGLSQLPEADAEIRAAIEARAQDCGWPALHAELQRIDPVAAARIAPNNRQRIQRALEVYQVSGQPISHWWQTQTETSRSYQWLAVGLMPADRSLLHQRIARRFDAMLAAGFVDEVQHLADRPDLHADLPAIRAVGYRQAWAYLAGQGSLEHFRESAIIATRQLARRQLTWMRRFPDLHVLPIDSGDLQLPQAVRSRLAELW